MQQNALNNLYNYSNMIGEVGGIPTLSAQELAANNAYNNALLEMNQQAQQFDQNYNNRQYWVNLLDVLGSVVNQEMADALGVPVGTTSVAYRDLYV